MDVVWHELTAEIGDVAMLTRIVVRLLLAVVLGGFIGLNREHVGEDAGWRTHILVTLAAAVFLMAMRESGGSTADLSRIIQGIATGIGFVGAGSILKLSDQVRVKGLTTAASIWLAAAVGIGVGMGRIWLPLVATLLGWITLAYLVRFEHHVQRTAADHAHVVD